MPAIRGGHGLAPTLEQRGGESRVLPEADAVPQAIGREPMVLGEEEDGIPFELGDLEGFPGVTPPRLPPTISSPPDRCASRGREVWRTTL